MTRGAVREKRSAERAALAEAIRDRDEAVGRLRQAEEAHAEVEGKFGATRLRWYEAYHAVERAKSTLNEALRAHGGDEDAVIKHAYKTDQPLPRDALAKAEREYKSTEEAMELGKEGANRAKGVKLAAEEEVEYKTRSVCIAMEAVCQTALPGLVAAAEKARDEFLARRAVLTLVSRELNGVVRNYGIVHDPLPVRIRSFFSRIEWDGAKTDDWDQARLALMNDPDAPLPA